MKKVELKLDTKESKLFNQAKIMVMNRAKIDGKTYDLIVVEKTEYNPIAELESIKSQLTELAVFFEESKNIQSAFEIHEIIECLISLGRD